MPLGRNNYFPKNPENFYVSLDLEDDEKSEVTSAAYGFFTALRRMKTEELARLPQLSAKTAVTY